MKAKSGIVNTVLSMVLRIS